MAQIKISTFKRRFRKSSRQQLLRVSRNRRKIYNPNAVKATKLLLLKRKKRR